MTYVIPTIESSDQYFNLVSLIAPTLQIHDIEN